MVTRRPVPESALRDPLFWLVFLIGLVVGVVGVCILLVARGIHPPVDMVEDYQLPTLPAAVAAIGGAR